MYVNFVNKLLGFYFDREKNYFKNLGKNKKKN